MADHPSWQTSTLSQLTGICVVAFLVGSTVSGVGVIAFKLPLDQAKAILEPFSWLTGLFVTAYLTARKSNGNGGEPPAPPVAPA